MDPFTMYLVGQGLGALGGAASSGQNNKMTKAQLAEQAREFNEQQNFAHRMGEVQNTFGQVNNINDLQRQMEMAPTRDKTLYMLNQRMGMVPQNFNPRDMMNPQSSGNQAPSQGGIDPAKLQSAMQTYQAPDFNGGTYKAGSGGVNPYMYAQLLGKLGISGTFAQPHIGEVIANTTTVGGGGQSQGQGGNPAQGPAGAAQGARSAMGNVFGGGANLHDILGQMMPGLSDGGAPPAPTTDPRIRPSFRPLQMGRSYS